MAPKVNDVTVSFEGRLRHSGTIVAKVQPKVDAIMRWILFATQRSPSTYLAGRYPLYCDGEIISTGCEIITGLWEFAPALVDALRLSVGLLDVAVHFWIKKNRDVDRFVLKEGDAPPPHHPNQYLVMPSGNGCGVIKLTHILFGDHVIGPNLWERWASCMADDAIHGYHLDPCVFFVRILMSRISQVKDLGCQADNTLFSFAANITRLMCIGNTFMPDLKTGTPGNIALHKAGYVGLLAKTIRSISERCSESGEAFINHPDAPPGPVQCIDLLDGLPHNLFFADMLVVLANAAPYLDRFSEPIAMKFMGSKAYKPRATNHLRGIIARAVCYPLTAELTKKTLLSLSDDSRKALNKAVAELYDPEPGTLLSSNPDDWVGEMIREVGRWNEVFRASKREWRLKRCDNFTSTVSEVLVFSKLYSRTIAFSFRPAV